MRNRPPLAHQNVLIIFRVSSRALIRSDFRVDRLAGPSSATNLGKPGRLSNFGPGLLAPKCHGPVRLAATFRHPCPVSPASPSLPLPDAAVIASSRPSPSPPLAPFLKRLGVVVGGIAAALLTIGLAGLVWEPAAMAATALSVAAAIGLVFTGRIWMIVAAWKDKYTRGLLSMLVPIYAYYYAFTRRGAALRGFAVLLSGFVPLLLSMGLMLAYMPMYSTTARRSANQADRQARAEAIVQRSEQQSDPNSPIKQTTFRLISRRNIGRLASDGEPAVRDCRLFVHGSIEVDREAGTVRFRHRGGDALASQYRLLIMNASETVIGPPIDSVVIESKQAAP